MSLLLHPPAPRPRLLAALFFEAVLPALAELWEARPEVHQGVSRPDWSLSLRTPWGDSGTFRFRGDRAHYQNSDTEGTDITLCFLSKRHVGRQLQNKWGGSPFPLRGMTRWRDIRVFARLGERLDALLNGGASDEFTLSAQRLRAKLTMGICLRGGCCLLREEPYSMKKAERIPEGYAEFVIGENTFRGWVGHRDGDFRTGYGDPPEESRVQIFFRDPEVALDALENRLDLFAALPLGTVEINGYLPLGDAFGEVLERLPAYLQPKK